MKKPLVYLLVMIGAWWYADRNYNREAILARAHRSPAAAWASPAVYWIALSYYARDDNQLSLKALNQLLEDDPKGRYAPRALLRLSEVDQELRNNAGAREALERFLSEFPDDPERATAEKRRNAIPPQ